MKSEAFSTSKGNLVEFLQSSSSYTDFYLNCIREAKESIILQTYIFQMDEFGKMVFSELLKARERDVLVYVLVDAVGSAQFKVGDENELKNAGVFFYRFNEMQFKGFYQWGRRLHHKVLICDQAKSIVGGINITNTCEYESNTPRLDFAVCLQGPVNKELNNYCQMIFKKTAGKNFSFKLKDKEITSFSEGLDVAISVNDWMYGHRQITREYSRLARTAVRGITIINSYFFPRKKFMKQLVKAAKRGVRVRLILPRLSDWPSYVLASEYLYSFFLRNNIEIYQWKKSILHGKLATIDGECSTIGSFNLNYTSYQQNLEVNVNIYSREFALKLNEEIENIIKSGCEKLDPEKFIKRSSMKKTILRFFYYIILSIIAGFSIGLTFQDEGVGLRKLFNIVTVSASALLLILGLFGMLLPVVSGSLLFAIGLLLIGRQIILNRK